MTVLMTNTSKPTTSFTNISRVASAELWSTITSTWATETRTWLGTISLITDGSKPTTSITNIAKPA